MVRERTGTVLALPVSYSMHRVRCLGLLCVPQCSRLSGSAVSQYSTLHLLDRSQWPLEAETRGERLQPVVPLGREMVASLVHNAPLRCAPRFLRQMVAVGHDYNAQGGLDIKIRCII